MQKAIDHIAPCCDLTQSSLLFTTKWMVYDWIHTSLSWKNIKSKWNRIIYIKRIYLYICYYIHIYMCDIYIHSNVWLIYILYYTNLSTSNAPQPDAQVMSRAQSAGEMKSGGMGPKNRCAAGITGPCRYMYSHPSVPPGKPQIAIENGHRNSGFTH